jgi:1,4-dihydroxy-2-naphthoate octaprenyltransferase
LLRRSTIQLLRFHFSLFLLPVYLFALSQAPVIHWQNALLIFFILHVLVYPSSNGYNSYMDRDETPIGGLSSPLQPTRQLFHVTIAMDVLAILLSITINIFFAAGVVVYILASRAYSYRGIRLKKYPVIGFLTVFIFQGGWIYYFVYRSIVTNQQTPSLLETLLASLLIGALYPLTQIYQHKEDLQDGVKTISYLLGKRGTFVFSMLLFLAANTLMFILFNQPDKNNHFFLFLLFLLPVVLFFLYWMSRVWKDEAKADFTNSLRMNVLATLCTTAFFITLIILNH